jgi:hypothetical protein
MRLICTNGLKESFTAFELSDGTIVKNEAEAIAKEKKILFDMAIEKLVDEKVPYTEYKETVLYFINENKAELKKIFEDNVDDEDDEKDVIVRWCDICDMYTEYSDDTPYGTCQCS